MKERVFGGETEPRPAGDEGEAPVFGVCGRGRKGDEVRKIGAIGPLLSMSLDGRLAGLGGCLSSEKS